METCAAMITSMDAGIGKIGDALKDKEELENTLIVFSSDHGEMLGDHARWAKAVPYHPSERSSFLHGQGRLHPRRGWLPRHVRRRAVGIGRH